MALWWDRGQVVDDSQEGVRVPEGATRVTMYRNPGQSGSQEFGWDPQQRYFSGFTEGNHPGIASDLIGLQDRLRAGQLQPYEQEGVTRLLEESRAIPTRDIASLTAGWQGEQQGHQTEHGWQSAGAWHPGDEDWWTPSGPWEPGRRTDPAPAP